MTKRTAARLGAAFLLLVCALLLAMPVSSFAKSYHVADVSIDATVQPNGDLIVSERRTFVFDGDFSRVFWTFPTADTGGYEVTAVREISPDSRTFTRTEDFSALDSRPNGTYLVQESGGQIEVDAFHRTSNSQAVFEIDYRVKGAAKRYTDAAELYWQAIGPNWDVDTKHATVVINPPGQLTKDDVRAWAHGPLNGVVAISDAGVVTLTVDDVPPNTFVEARVLYPASALPAAAEVTRPRRQQVLTEEKGLAEQANRQRLAARTMMAVWVGIPWIAAILALVFGIRAFVLHGREHRAEFQGQYFREDPRPDLHPAVIGALMRFGRVEDQDIAATLMDLADKGIVKMVPYTSQKDGIAGMFGGTEQSYLLQRVREKESEATLLDKQLLSLLFDQVGGGRDSVGLNEIPRYAKANPQTFSTDVKQWKESASTQAELAGFFEPEGRAWQVGIFVVAVFLAAVAVFGAVQTGSGWPLLLPIPVAIALAALGIFMNRRSRQGNELFRQYSAVKQFLLDFSRMKEAPPSSIILWNRFLVLAVVFGVAEEVIEQLRVRMPEVVSDPAFQTSYWWVYAGGYGHSPISTLSTSFATASQVASSQMSSGSGFGGGFSGGGGGGFGGGGGGAD